MALVVDKYVVIREFDTNVDANVELQNGDWIDISVTGSIWAGVWFTGRNGPNGWPGWSANNDSPLPGAAPFGVLGWTAEDNYFWIGSGMRRTYQNSTLGPGRTRLSFRINDDRPGNGDGAFIAKIQVWR
ncbi:hypothetical protein E0H73_41070 [Kribbella pittospori]|uniref:Uncharacterized protein n=1 Tax=Kribbella pittospori TaxID=722689 RepID=A0A4R0JVI8_9ACTN|nr:hypothetical protein [Kribbella pittospori]TCC51511.1 hypothetical protein E0H73_41070 [Kribbella pittospori]